MQAVQKSYTIVNSSCKAAIRQKGLGQTRAPGFWQAFWRGSSVTRSNRLLFSACTIRDEPLNRTQMPFLSSRVHATRKETFQRREVCEFNGHSAGLLC